MLAIFDHSLESVAAAVVFGAVVVWLRRFVQGWRRASRQRRYTVIVWRGRYRA